MFSPLHPNISMQVLQTALYTCTCRFLVVLTRKICQTIKSLSLQSFPFIILTTFMFDSGVILFEKIRCLLFTGRKGLNDCVKELLSNGALANFYMPSCGTV